MEETIQSENQIPHLPPYVTQIYQKPQTPLFLKFFDPSSCMVDFSSWVLLVDDGKHGNVRI
jgi:hypothetical protein